MSAAGAELRARNLRTLAALAALFLLPLAMAFCTYYGTAWRPSAHLNHGELISPVRPLPAVALPRIALEPAAPGAPPATETPFRGRWSLVYVGAGIEDHESRVLAREEAALAARTAHEEHPLDAGHVVVECQARLAHDVQRPAAVGVAVAGAHVHQ